MNKRKAMTLATATAGIVAFIPTWIFAVSSYILKFIGLSKIPFPLNTAIERPITGALDQLLIYHAVAGGVLLAISALLYFTDRRSFR